MQPRATAQVSGFVISSPTVTSKAAVGALEGHVAEELLPDHAVDVSESPHVEAGVTPHPLDPLHPFGQPTAHLTDADQAHAVVVHGSGLGDGRPEAFGDPDDDLVLTDMAGNALAGPEPVLERHHHISGPQQAGDPTGHLVDVGRLGGDDPQVARSGIGRCRRDLEAIDDIAAAGAGNPQPIGLDGIEVLPPRIDGPDLVAGLPEERGVHRAHCTRSDNGNLHRTSITVTHWTWNRPSCHQARACHPRVAPDRGQRGRSNLHGASRSLHTARGGGHPPSRVGCRRPRRSGSRARPGACHPPGRPPS